MFTSIHQRLEFCSPPHTGLGLSTNSVDLNSLRRGGVTIRKLLRTRSWKNIEILVNFDHVRAYIPYVVIRKQSCADRQSTESQYKLCLLYQENANGKEVRGYYHPHAFRPCNCISNEKYIVLQNVCYILQGDIGELLGSSISRRSRNHSPLEMRDRQIVPGKVCRSIGNSSTKRKVTA